MAQRLFTGATAQRLLAGVIALVILSAVAVFALYGIFSLTNPAGRFAPPHPLALAGPLEASRNLALAAMLLAALLLRNRGALAILVLTGGLIELGDAVIGLGQHQAGMVVGPLFSGCLYLACGAYLVRRARGEGVSPQ